MTEQELVTELSRQAVRCRTGILLVHRRHLGKEGDIAARCGAQSVDAAATIAESISESSTYVHITASKLFDLVDQLTRRSEGADCLLVYNLDLPLAKLEAQDRLQLWRNLKDNLPYRQRAVVFVMPTAAQHLLPLEDELSEWESSLRLARMP